MKKNKWLNGALPAILIHGSIGSVYAWSLFVNPISDHIGKSHSAVQFAFSLAIFFLGMSAAFGGKIVEKNINVSSKISLGCFCSGLLVAGLGVYLKSLLLIYLGYGVIMGIGLGIGYITPVKTLMLWFKDNKGLATGIAVCAFGFASSLASVIITYLLSKVELHNVFVILAVIYMFPMIFASFLLEKPKWWKEENVKSDFKYKDIIKNTNFILIWFIVYFNIACGLALIPIASPLLSEFELKPTTIALVVSIMGIFNGAGRIGISAASDKLFDRKYIYTIIAIVSAILCAFCHPYDGFNKNPFVFILTLCIISACYGAGFSCLPSLLSDLFGMNDISKIHGLALTAWAIAGLTGNQFSSMLNNMHGSYKFVFPWLVFFYIIEAILVSRISKKN